MSHAAKGIEGFLSWLYYYVAGCRISQRGRFHPHPAAKHNIERTNAMPAKESLIGQRFGKLQVIIDHLRHVYANRRTVRKCLCLCDCGSHVLALASNLKTGHTFSCGCLRTERTRAAILVHGHSRWGNLTSPTYRSWASMRQRCENPRSQSFPNYGGRGIKVCPDWKHFSVFLRDMGERPFGTSLGRINNSGNYCPVNCAWQRRNEQAVNKRNTWKVSLAGESVSASQLARSHGMLVCTFRYRVQKLGWSVNKALKTPLR